MPKAMAMAVPKLMSVPIVMYSASIRFCRSISSPKRKSEIPLFAHRRGGPENEIPEQMREQQGDRRSPEGGRISGPQRVEAVHPCYSVERLCSI